MWKVLKNPNILDVIQPWRHIIYWSLSREVFCKWQFEMEHSGTVWFWFSGKLALVHKEGKPIYPCPSTGKWLLYCPICWLNCQKISLCIGTYVFVMSIAFFILFQCDRYGVWFSSHTKSSGRPDGSWSPARARRGKRTAVNFSVTKDRSIIVTY